MFPLTATLYFSALVLGVIYTLLPCQAAFPTSCLADYPIAGYPLMDFDVNCNVAIGNNSFFFYPRSVNGVAPASLTAPYPAAIEALRTNSSLPASARTYDTIRLNYRAVVSAGRKVILPIDLRPSVLPNFTVEYFVSVGSIQSNNIRALWSTDLANMTSATGLSHGPHLLVYDAYGSGSGFAVRFPTPAVGGKLNYGSGYAHVALIYQHNIKNVTLVINGRFTQNWTQTLIDQSNYVTLGGINGTSASDAGSQTWIYYRVWNRSLALSELRLLADEAMYPYCRPIITTPYPYAVFNPTQGGNAFFSMGSSAQNPFYNLTSSGIFGYNTNNVTAVASGTVSQSSTSQPGYHTHTHTLTHPHTQTHTPC